MKHKLIATILIGSLLAVSAAGCSSVSDADSETAEADSSAGEDTDAEDSTEEDADEEDDSEVTDETSFSQMVFAMDTYMTVTAYGTHGEEAVEAAVEEIERLDGLISVGDEGSEIYAVNTYGSGTLSPELGYLVMESLELYETTDGLFDIAIYPLMDAWGFTTQKYQVPDAETIDTLLELTDASLINYDSYTGDISFGMEGMQIDLGGIAKGYTSSQIMEIFTEYGVTSGLVSLGGNVHVLGTKVDGSLWRVAIQDPDDSSSYIGVLSTSDTAVITSGGYERYFEEDGVTYHHIIDPRTGYPADSGVISSTIVSSDGTLADGLSTALYIMGVEDAIDYWREYGEEFDFILMDEEKNVYITEGIADSFETDYTMVVVTADGIE